MRLSLPCLLLVGSIFAGCPSSSPSEIDSGVVDNDSGVHPDAAPHLDATVNPDATTNPDAMPSPDAEPAPDAMGPADTGPSPDAGCVAPLADCNGDGMSCETDTSTNSLSCGACGHSCFGATCSSSLCDPTVLATPGNAYRSGVSGSFVYYIRVNAFPPSSYNLHRVPVDGTGIAEPISNGAGAPGGLDMDQTHVYFAIQGTPSTVYQKAHTASATSTPEIVFTTPDLPLYLVRRSDAFYWISQYPNVAPARVFRRALNAPPNDVGAEIAHGVDRSRVTSFAATSSVAYWVEDDLGGHATLKALVLSSTVVRTIVDAPISTDANLHVDQGAVYWALRDSGRAGVYRYYLGGSVQGLVSRVNLYTAIPDPTSDQVYIGEAFSGTSISVISKGGGALRRIASHGAGNDFAGLTTNFLFVVDAPLDFGEVRRIVR